MKAPAYCLGIIGINHFGSKVGTVVVEQIEVTVVVLSLYLPSPHAALYYREEFISSSRSVPSPMTLAFAESLEARHSQNSHHPFPMGDGFAATLVRCFAAACRVARPPVRI